MTFTGYFYSIFLTYEVWSPWVADIGSNFKEYSFISKKGKRKWLEIEIRLVKFEQYSNFIILKSLNRFCGTNLNCYLQSASQECYYYSNGYLFSTQFYTFARKAEKCFFANISFIFLNFQKTCCNTFQMRKFSISFVLKPNNLVVLS